MKEKLEIYHEVLGAFEQLFLEHQDCRGHLPTCGYDSDIEALYDSIKESYDKLEASTSETNKQKPDN